MRRREFLWIIAVYGPTYIAANTIDSLCKIYRKNDIVPKLVGVTFVNMIMSILKDRAYARYFASKPMAVPVGMISLAFWLVRDVSTIGAGFVIPSRLSKVVEKTGMEEDNAENFAQMASPIFA